MSIENLNKTIDVAAKLAAPVGVVVMLWLQSQFVTRVPLPEGTYAVKRNEADFSKIQPKPEEAQ
jgi:hypothetical protein